MTSRNKRKPRMTFWDKTDVLEATSENFRIDVDRAFQNFLADGSLKEFSFPSTLNNFERKHIHQKASAYNLSSRSHGKDPNRILTISKKRNKSNFESFDVVLTEASKNELRKLIQTYTPQAVSKPVTKLNSSEKVFGKLSLGRPPPVAEPNVSPEIRAFQRQLPIFEMKNLVLDKIRNNQVLIVSSETGSGKTTQIPQYIMDDARDRKERCRILCTQPRRISAVSVAERVADERGSSLGETVGYHIRLESKLGSNCNLIYCTNGVLIRSLMSGDRVLSSLTHIIIDEVHERDKLSDFLLICLRESLRKGANIKLILMSATVNVDKFRTYFEGSEVLSIPGRLFDIQQFFLDEVLEITRYDQVLMDKQKFCAEAMISGGGGDSLPNPHYDDIIMQCFGTRGVENEQAWAQMLQYMLSESMPVNYQHSETGLTALIAAVFQDNVDLVEKLCSLGADPKVAVKQGYTALSVAEDKGNEEIVLLLTMTARAFFPREEILSTYYKTVADEDINYELLTRLVCTICCSYMAGAILVFLPGYDDIMMCYENILNSDLDPSTYRVFFMHGSMNIREQHEVFRRLPVRKIILSTNIAETSLTIDDVVYVIDSGKAKVQTYDSCSGLSSLQVQWISKACVKQRAGRAGRTQNGMCFHLFSRLRFESFLDERIPEILRVPLEELCLNTKTLAGNFSSIYNFLVMAPDPPSPNSVKTAIENLECLGALDSEETLTPLGEYLSQLTIEPHLGKMLIYSVIFRCMDPILTIVASLAQKDPFQLPPQANLRTNAAEKRKSLTVNTYSDHMVYLKAFIKWQEAVRGRKERNFCRDFFISASTMETILKTRSQLLGQLRAAKFVPPCGDAMLNLNTYSENWPLVKAVISSGLYPKLAFKKNAHFCTRTEKKILIHNSSPIGKENINLWLVYDEMVKVRNGHQVRGVTPVTPVTISLMCGNKATSPQENYLAIDEWLEFEFPNPHIIFLRLSVEDIIEKKLASPTNVLTRNEETVLQALANILIAEDQAAGMDNPAGIKQKPKFFELNRMHETTAGRKNGLAVPYYQHQQQQAASTSNHSQYFAPQVQGDFRGRGQYRNYYNPGFNGQDAATYFPSEEPQKPADFAFGGFQPNRTKDLATNYSRPGTSSDGYSPAVGGGIAANHQSFGLPDYGYVGGPCYAAQSRSFYGTNGSRVGAVNGFDSKSGSSSGSTDSQPVDNAVFFLITVKQESSVKIAHETNKWVFAPQTEKQIVASDNAGTCVYLVYTVHKMNTFYGIAKFVCLDRTKPKISALIEWKFKSEMPYKRVSHLRNPLNNNRLIYDGTDGQPIAREVAVQLWDLYLLEERGCPLRRLN